ncbi:enoyl-CoA hydratase/isomerase family protein [Streptomyces albipurpureus]|uniref:Enoyl-CoA hydratase-related protein n=1 Tax=Streptomyces albipurpureus TaxID=2897419 RepID=A0ABT0UYR3_9ACTN|nr:enoyl-CoA hydratase-related protein [Streptomyces sp. CWNU-1]MCM2393572.1 enoyl-CoA hydratase-related protein [Streptomyces sp. CWNU-1]
MTATGAVLTVVRHGPVTVLEIDRPTAKNALNEAVMTGLTAELDRIRHDETVRAVVLTGAGGVFCAGADITAFNRMRAEALLGPRPTLGGSLWSDLATFPKPVVAAVEGLAFGGGFELALACDTVIAGTSAKFAVPEVRLGVIPGGGGTQRLVHALGKARAMALLLTGDTLPADEAAMAGVVSQVVPDGEALSRALKLAGRIARNSPLAVALAKDAALRAFETSLAQGLEHEKRNFHVAIHSADSREGERAFLDKRTPEFTGE